MKTIISSLFMVAMLCLGGACGHWIYKKLPAWGVNHITPGDMIMSHALPTIIMFFIGLFCLAYHDALNSKNKEK